MRFVMVSSISRLFCNYVKILKETCSDATELRSAFLDDYPSTCKKALAEFIVPQLKRREDIRFILYEVASLVIATGSYTFMCFVEEIGEQANFRYNSLNYPCVVVRDHHLDEWWYYIRYARREMMCDNIRKKALRHLEYRFPFICCIKDVLGTAGGCFCYYHIN